MKKERKNRERSTEGATYVERRKEELNVKRARKRNEKSQM